MSQFVPNLGPKGHAIYRLLRLVNRGLVRRFLSDLEDPSAAAERQLRGLIAGARGCDFWLEHGAETIQSLEEFRAAIPIRSHTELKPWLDRVAEGEQGVLVREKTEMLLETSGTTGAPKHLPVTRTWARHVQEAQRLWTLALIRDHPELQGGKALTMASPAVHGHSSGGIPVGSNTGRIRSSQPGWLRKRYAVPDLAMEIEDPVARQYAALRFGLGVDVRSVTTANPSLLLLLFRRLEEWRPHLSKDLEQGTLSQGPASVLPEDLRRRLEGHLKPVAPPQDWSPAALWNLSTVNCWTGGPARYFADRLATTLPGVSIRELGVTASEGSFAFPLAADWPGSVLWMSGHLMEFVVESGKEKWAWEREVGDRVRLVISTAAGLFRYDMADELEVVGHCLNTPLVRFVGKSGRYLNLLGERVTEGQVSAAMASMKLDIAGFTLRAIEGDVPFYVIGIEGNSVPDGVADGFDSALAQQNVEYASMRKSGLLGAPRLHRLQPGHYARYRAGRVSEGAPEGQLKDPILACTAEEWAMVIERWEDA